MFVMCFFYSFFLLFVLLTTIKSQNTVRWFVTASDQSQLFEFQNDLTIENGQSNINNIITLNEDTTYQRIYGFGAALTQSSAYLLTQYKQENQDNY